jgi:hypothetical protein
MQRKQNLRTSVFSSRRQLIYCMVIGDWLMYQHQLIADVLFANWLMNQLVDYVVIADWMVYQLTDDVLVADWLLNQFLLLFI